MKKRLYKPNPFYKILVKGGEWVEIAAVLVLYRCEECHARLKRHNAGVICSENREHKHVIHRDTVAEIQARQIEDLRQAEESYVVENDRLIYKGEPRI